MWDVRQHAGVVLSEADMSHNSISVYMLCIYTSSVMLCIYAGVLEVNKHTGLLTYSSFLWPLLLLVAPTEAHCQQTCMAASSQLACS